LFRRHNHSSIGRLFSALRSSRIAGLVIVALFRTGLFAETPYGLDNREPIGRYLNNLMPPKAGAFPFPAVLSATGAFSDVNSLTPSNGVVPYAVNSANDNWGDNPNVQEIIDTTIAPTSPKESVILTQLPSNDTGIGYTAVLRGASVAAGVALVEVYDLDGGLGSAVLNVSTRGHVETGENVMIGGFILGGNESKKIIVRAIGPSLAGSGVANPLNDPVLELHSSNGDAIATDDGWKDKQQTEIQNTGIPPTDDRESAIVAVLPAGSYTAVVRGANNSTGVALVEAYQLP
jgi:hypothetical protein